MAEVKISGWQAIVVLLGLGAFIAIRINSISDMTNNEALMRKVRMELMSEYLPDELNKVEAMREKHGDDAAFDRVGELASTEIDIKELKGSYPVYDFSSGKRKVIIKVRFTIKDSEGIIKDGLNFYECEYQPIGNTWYIKHESGEYRYYMNFIL